MYSVLKIDKPTSKPTADAVFSLAAHQMRTPLAAIKGAVDLLASDLETLDSDQADLVRLIRRNADRSIRLVENLLLLSRIDKGGLELNVSDFAPEDLCREVVSSLGGRSLARGVDFAVVTGNSNAEFRGDRERCVQLLSFLVDNAASFATPSSTATISWQYEGMSFSFLVADEGPGIGPTEADKLFEPFYRQARQGDVKAVGDGLGLAVAYALAKLMGGEIVYLSNDKGGSTFQVNLPALSVS